MKNFNPHILIIQALEEALRYDYGYVDKAISLYNEGRYVIVFAEDDLGDRVEYSFDNSETVRFTIFQ